MGLTIDQNTVKWYNKQAKRREVLLDNIQESYEKYVVLVGLGRTNSIPLIAFFLFTVVILNTTS